MKSERANVNRPNPDAIKRFLRYVAWSFLISVIFFEGCGQMSVPLNRGYWTIRERQEGATLEMHAEDIWAHGKSTFKKFDPMECKMTPRQKWLTHWSDVECFAEDENGQKWRYTAKYRDTHTTMFFIPFMTGQAPFRKMERISRENTAQEVVK